jgi:hexosaminidase
VKEKGEYLRPGNTLYHVYHYDPQAGIEPEFQKFVIGTQGNMWSEYVPDREDLEYKLFPRTLALSEIAWTQVANKNWDAFLTKTSAKGYPVLEILGLRPCPINLGEARSWKSGDVPAGKKVTLEWAFPGNVGTPMEYGAGFVPTSGAVKVGNVQLKFGGKVVAEDKRELGTTVIGVRFTLKTESEPGDAAVTLTAEIFSESGTSSGHVYLYPM